MKRATIILAVVAIGAATMALASGRQHAPGGDATAQVAKQPQGRDFRIRGRASGLFPGSQGELVLTVRNPSRHPLTVRSIAAEVADASEACPAAHVTVGRFRGNLRVEAYRREQVVVPISMLAGAAAECQDASFPLTFSGRGTRG